MPTHHSKLVKSSAYLIESGLQKVLYTGDLIWIDKGYHHLFAGLGVVITDGSYLRAGGMIGKDKVTGQIYGHNSIPDLIRLFKPFTRHILFIHFGGQFFKDIKDARRRIVNLGNYYGITVHVGYDSIELDTHELQQFNPSKKIFDMRRNTPYAELNLFTGRIQWLTRMNFRKLWACLFSGRNY